MKPGPERLGRVAMNGHGPHTAAIFMIAADVTNSHIQETKTERNYRMEQNPAAQIMQQGHV